MVDVVPDPTEAAVVQPLAPGQLGIEMSQDVHEKTGDLLLNIRVRGEPIIDAQAHDMLLEAIAHAVAGTALRESIPTHVVHVEPQWREDTVQTYDPERVGGDPAGEDVTPASTTYALNPTTGAVDAVVTPEVRLPWWTFTERVQVNRPLYCPDCRRELRGDRSLAGDYLRCPQAPEREEVKVCHAGCVLACGLPE